jgi:hypothetical protein
MVQWAPTVVAPMPVSGGVKALAGELPFRRDTEEIHASFIYGSCNFLQKTK